MPIHIGQDKNGKFYQWGKTGKKYYFKPGDEASRKRARGKAEAQQTAIYSSGWKGDTMKLIKVQKTVKKADASEFDKFQKIADGVISKVQKELQNGIKQLDKLDLDKIEEEGEDPEDVERLMELWKEADNLVEGIR